MIDIYMLLLINEHWLTKFKLIIIKAFIITYCARIKSQYIWVHLKKRNNYIIKKIDIPRVWNVVSTLMYSEYINWNNLKKRMIKSQWIKAQ